MKPKQATFLQKTFDLLEQQSTALHWSEDGQSFGMTCVRDFCLEVLPKYSKHCSFASFVRQLNLYSFHKVRIFGFEAAFAHPAFRRHQPEGLSLIERKNPISRTIAKTVKNLSDPEKAHLDASLQRLLDQQTDLEVRTDSIDAQTAETLAISRRLASDFALHSEQSNTIDQLLMWLLPAIMHLERPFCSLPMLGPPSKRDRDNIG